MITDPLNQWLSAPFHQNVTLAIEEDADALGDKFHMSIEELRGAYLQVWLAFVAPAGKA